MKYVTCIIHLYVILLNLIKPNTTNRNGVTAANPLLITDDSKTLILKYPHSNFSSSYKKPLTPVFHSREILGNTLRKLRLLFRGNPNNDDCWDE